MEISREVFEILLEKSETFQDFCTRRLAHLLEQSDSPRAPVTSEGLEMPLASLMRHPPVTCLPETPLRQVFQQMQAAQVGSMMVTNASGELLGLLTLHDVLSRVLLPKIPYILMRFYTTPSVKEARASVAWSLFFIILLYFSAPALAAFAKLHIFQNIIGQPIASFDWLAFWEKVKLITVNDANGNGILDFGEMVLKNDAIVLMTSELAGMPYVIGGLVAAGALAAALSTADGLLLTIANAFGAVAGMIAGFSLTLFYLVAVKFGGMTPWFGIKDISAGIFGIPLGFAVIIIVSLLTPPPSRDVQDLVEQVRYPSLPEDRPTAS